MPDWSICNRSRSLSSQSSSTAGKKSPPYKATAASAPPGFALRRSNSQMSTTGSKSEFYRIERRSARCFPLCLIGPEREGGRISQHVSRPVQDEIGKERRDFNGRCELDLCAVQRELQAAEQTYAHTGKIDCDIGARAGVGAPRALSQFSTELLHRSNSSTTSETIRRIRATSLDSATSYASPYDLESILSSMPRLDVWQEVEVFFVFIHSAVTRADRSLRLDKTNFTNPLNHFEPELVLDT